MLELSMVKKPYTILAFGDSHKPYNHPDAYNFIFAVSEKYDPDRYINLEDDSDHHALSYHEKDPRLMSDDAELKAVIKENKKWYQTIPNMDLLDSNHGSLLLRKAKTHGISPARIKSMNEVIEAPKGWKWHDRLIVETGGFKILFKHQIKKNVLIAAQKMGICVVQGHFHSQADIRYTMNELGVLTWGVSCPCLIDIESYAFAYNKNDIDRPILGCLIIQDGIPKIIPMILNSKGRWNEKVL